MFHVTYRILQSVMSEKVRKIYKKITVYLCSSPADGATYQYNYQLSLTDPRDKIMLYTELDNLCNKLRWLSVGAGRYCQLSLPTTVKFITL